MNLGASAIVLRPRSVAEIMDLACRFTFARVLGLYARMSLAFLLPVVAGLIALELLVDVPAWALWTGSGALAIWLQGPFTLAVSRVMFGERPTVRSVAASFWSRIHFGGRRGPLERCDTCKAEAAHRLCR